MANIGILNPTITDVAKRLDPNGKVDKIVEILMQTNEVLEDMVVIEGNLPTGHKTTIRSGLPEAAWRMLNYGVQPSKSRTTQITDTCGMLEAYAEIDKDLADLNGNTASFRLSEDRAFLEAMNLQQASTLFYGDTTKNPERFLGLGPRYSEKDKSKADNAINILDAGGTGSKCASIYLTVWGENTMHAIYPKGSKAGFQHKDLGEVTLTDENGGRYQGYRTHYKWDIGLTVRDWRYIVRITNIPENLTGVKLIDLLVEASEMLPNKSMGRPAFYMNRQIRTALRKEIMNKNNVHLSIDDVAGKKVLTFDDIPVRRCDVLLNTEQAI